MVSFRSAGRILGLLAFVGASGIAFSYMSSELRKEIMSETQAFASGLDSGKRRSDVRDTRVSRRE